MNRIEDRDILTRTAEALDLPVGAVAGLLNMWGMSHLHNKER